MGAHNNKQTFKGRNKWGNHLLLSDQQTNIISDGKRPILVALRVGLVNLTAITFTVAFNEVIYSHNAALS